LIQEGHWPEGKKLLEESYTTYPNHLITLNSLGIVAQYERRLKDAEIFYQKAVELRPTYTPARNNLERIRKILYGDKE
jgi:tetratricopeptide (TPR) repeat protein